jgi:hypothetical protein
MVVVVMMVVGTGRRMMMSVMVDTGSRTVGTGTGPSHKSCGTSHNCERYAHCFCCIVHVLTSFSFVVSVSMYPGTPLGENHFAFFNPGKSKVAK